MASEEDHGDKTLLRASCCSPARCVSSFKSSLVRKSRALLGCSQSSDPSPPSGLEASPSTPPLHPNRAIRRVYTYDVFLSFRGTDTRHNIVDHLYNHLTRKGIFTFMDDKRLEKGEAISPQLLQAITDSRVSILVFSADYASSTWCLEEMAAIAECKRKSEQRVFPIFYNVDPSDVRKQSGVYEDAFALHSERFKQDPGKVDRWKTAMTDLANLVGWDFADKPEFTEIQKIIQKVIKALDRKFSGSADDLIGIQPRVRELERLLKLNSEDDDSRVLGLWGMGGIGKTTLATVLYDKISSEFDACCFIEDVNKVYKDGGAVAVQRQIIGQTLPEYIVVKSHSSKISDIISYRLCSLKVLIVLDNIDEVEQLENLALNPKLLGRGSRLIITTRNEHIFTIYKVVTIHKVSLLDYEDAYELFCGKAFKSDVNRNSNCEMLIPEILEYTQSLPLAIKVVGSFLRNRVASQWRDALERLRKNPDKKITDVLQLSFEGLQHEEKEIFLHIACFFGGEREEYVKKVLDSCKLHPHIGIPVLKERSLITIINQEIHMHEMLQEMGKKIVREKYPEEPTSWSRLWIYKDIEQVLTSEMETNHVKAIVLDQKKDDPDHSRQLRIERLSKMKGLKLLILHHKNCVGDLNFLSNNLQYLSWHWYPFSSLPSFESYSSLVDLNLPNSKITRLWEGHKNIPHLERMDLSNSKDLLETPDFKLSPNLKRLDLSGCSSLVRVHPSIGLLSKLAYLSLRGCCSLVTVDFRTDDYCQLSSLRVLHLSGCTELKNTPDFTGLSNLEYLDLKGCQQLATVHESVGALTMLKFFSLGGGDHYGRPVLKIPNTLNNMMSLQTLDLHNRMLQDLPLRQKVVFCSYLESLISLDLGNCDLIEIPASIGELSCLERLNLVGNRFTSLPNSIKRLHRLAYLNLTRCYDLNTLPELPFDRDPSGGGGRYFLTVSTSRNDRSGLHLFGCYRLMESSNMMLVALSWLARLVEQPCHFRCGFDIVVPTSKRAEIPEWYFNHQFERGSFIRIVDFDVDDNWLGFAFCVTFEADVTPVKRKSRLLRLSFENGQTEECFNAPSYYNTHTNPYSSEKKITHGWIIYISREHCHFVKTGARIGFKVSLFENLVVKIHKWGLRMVFKQDIEMLKRKLHSQNNEHFNSHRLVIKKVQESGSISGTNKIRLPYNWLVSEEEEGEKMEAKIKEDNLSYAGLNT